MSALAKAHHERREHEDSSLRAVRVRLPESGWLPSQIHESIARDVAWWPMAAIYSLLGALQKRGEAHEREGKWFPGPELVTGTETADHRGPDEDLEDGSPAGLEVVAGSHPAPSEPESEAPVGPPSSEGAAAPPPLHPPGGPTPPEVGAGTPSRGGRVMFQPDPQSLTQRVCADLATHPEAAAAEVGARVGISGSKAAKVLSNLKATGRAVRTGVEGHFRYSIPGPEVQPQESADDTSTQRDSLQHVMDELTEARRQIRAHMEAWGELARWVAIPHTPNSPPPGARPHELIEAVKTLRSDVLTAEGRARDLEEDLKMWGSANVTDEPPDPPAFAEQFADPSHILIWPIRDANGKRTGRWECSGPHTGVLGGDAQTGATPRQVLDRVFDNFVALGDDVDAVRPCPPDHVDVFLELEDVAQPGTPATIEAYVVDEATEAHAGNVVLLVRVPRSQPRRPVIDVRGRAS